MFTWYLQYLRVVDINPFVSNQQVHSRIEENSVVAGVSTQSNIGDSFNIPMSSKKENFLYDLNFNNF